MFCSCLMGFNGSFQLWNFVVVEWLKWCSCVSYVFRAYPSENQSKPEGKKHMTYTISRFFYTIYTACIFTYIYIYTVHILYISSAYLCIYIYVCVCIGMERQRVYIYACMYTYIYVYYVCIYIYIYVYMYTQWLHQLRIRNDRFSCLTYLPVQVHRSTSRCVNIYQQESGREGNACGADSTNHLTFTYTYIYICIYVYMCVYICLHS